VHRVADAVLGLAATPPSQSITVANAVATVDYNVDERRLLLACSGLGCPAENPVANRVD